VITHFAPAPRWLCCHRRHREAPQLFKICHTQGPSSPDGPHVTLASGDQDERKAPLFLILLVLDLEEESHDSMMGGELRCSTSFESPPASNRATTHFLSGNPLPLVFLRWLRDNFPSPPSSQMTMAHRGTSWRHVGAWWTPHSLLPTQVAGGTQESGAPLPPS
jgi:hypothetical protein